MAGAVPIVHRALCIMHHYICLMKLLFTTLLALASQALFAQSFSGPEAVEYDPLNNRYIVSNTSSGNLQSVVPGSAPVLFTANVSSPYGLVFVDSTVYVNDAGDVKGFNLFTGLQTFTANVNGSFLNGICADNSGHLYTTDFSAKKIYKVNIADGSFTQFVSATVKTPNGILFDAANNRLVYCTWGTGVQLKAVSLVDSSQTVLITTTLSNDDGIAMDNQGRFFVSVWGGQSIYMIDSACQGPPVQVISGLSNPADIYYNLSNDTLAVPNSGNNTVQFFNMSQIVAVKQNMPSTGSEGIEVYKYSDHVTFRWKDFDGAHTTLEIRDSNGKLIERADVNENEYTISQADLATGIYFIAVTIDQKTITGRFRVE